MRSPAVIRGAAPSQRHTRSLICTFWMMLVGGLVVTAAAPVCARELHIQSFDARIVVTADAWIETVETIRARFDGEWQGLYRTIPVEYRTPQGLNFTLWLDVVRVTDDSGALLAHEVSREHRYRKLKVFVPGAVDATKTIIITYRVANALRFFPHHDELYWNITGDQWDVPLEAVSAHIQLPAGVNGVRAIPYTGSFGSRAHDATVQLLGGGEEVDVRANAPLGFHEGVTVSVSWNKGFVREPSWGAGLVLFLGSNWALLAPLLAFGLMWLVWRWRGRDPRLLPIVVRYSPPQGLTPAEAGGLTHDRVGTKDITATIIDLAVRGYLSIEETAKPPEGKKPSSQEYAFHLRKDPSQWTGLKSHEQKVLEAVFVDGKPPSVPLTDLTNQFYKSMSGISAAVLESLLAQRFYVERPDKVRKHYAIATVVLGLLMGYGALVAVDHFGMAPAPFVIGLLATVVIMFVFAWHMPARTRAGTEALQELLGFRDFLNQVEKPRFEQMGRTPALFETFLSYAVAFKLESQWAAAFNGIYVTAGDWYTGPLGHSFQATDFASSITRMSSSMGSTFESSPGSSGGSGSGGGGSSGGGSGGGGGGGF